MSEGEGEGEGKGDEADDGEEFVRSRLVRQTGRRCRAACIVGPAR